jgi:hypothetical protein
LGQQAKKGVLSYIMSTSSDPAAKQTIDGLKYAFFSEAPPVGSTSNEKVSDLCFVFVARVVLGAFVQLGTPATASSKQLRSNESVFSAGTRELALIPGVTPPSHYHSAIAEVSGLMARPGTHTEPGGNSLRFREMIVFRPTLIYPEYLIAYRRKK